ncbi:transcriptional regulator Myc-A-like [Agrilus planipennis]|uniref:Transcriptional regulator Myc-A-like n=1 Tax=Agrilus planipennis TaxID=224129 RepID=A0A1W4XMW7_AGRPL|nr:transcriptional regulator Myc-A-like [Agrilus planipennis]
MLKMPVKTATTLTSSNGCHVLDSLLIDDEDVCFYELLSNDEPLLSDDIWKKFDLEDLPLPGLESILRDLEEEQPLTPHIENNSSSNNTSNNNMNGCNNDSPQVVDTIRNHDCMWAGHCGSKEHPADALFCISNGNNCKAAVAPGSCVRPQVKTPVKLQQQPVVSAGRSLLLKTFAKQASTTTLLPPTSTATAPLVPSPESPPISDDEGQMSPNAILKALYEAIEECDEVDEDSDLCEYFEEPEEEEEDDDDDEEEEEEEEDDDLEFELREEPSSPPSATSCKPLHFTPEIDHSYHKGKLPHAHFAGLGIDTPSDSEEEIDVVSVGGEKQTILNNNRCGYVLPNNPTFKDRQHLQRTMASAIQIKQQQQESSDSRRINNTNNTTTAFVKPPRTFDTTTTTTTPAKRHLPEPRAVKRNKINHYRIAQTTTSPYKRRMGYSSDSEPEPSEKRSLHNNMERQRRIDLRNAFDCLRLLVPEVAGRERAPKVVILREAASYCDHLGEVSINMHQQINDLRKQQEKLRARVSQLRRNLAAKR